MKHINKELLKKSIKPRYLLSVGVGFLLVASLSFSPVFASLQEQINQLNAQNSNKEEKVEDLEDSASSIEDRINKIAGQIASKQFEINKSEKTISKLEKTIKQKEIELEKQRDLLGQNIRAMYIEGDISTLEMLASSKDLSEFVDKEQYRNSVQEKIKTTLATINELKDQLENEKAEIELLLKDQKERRDELSNQKAEQDGLLSLNASERSQLNSQIKANSKKIAELQAEQVRQNLASLGGSVVPGVRGGGGYPYGNAVCLFPGAADPPCMNYDWGYPNASPYNRRLFDEWGYGYRNCTSWVAYRVTAAKGYTPAGLSNLGHAKSWPYNTSRPTGNTPKKGAAAVTGGTYGHVRYVEQKNSDGSIVVSDYNLGGDGVYRVYTVSAATASTYTYIYF